ncbi:MAG: hypothetical protein JSS34_07015 [Proteobacteria bacterium]|nr:hypothetical protein [Pseudomonadota bacterium]
MKIKSFLSQLLCSVVILVAINAQVSSMTDILPAPLPIGGDGPIVPSIPEVLPVVTPIADATLTPPELPRNVDMLDPSTLSNIESIALSSNYHVEAGNIKVWAPDPHTLEVDQFSSAASHDPSVGIINFNRLSTLPGETFRILYFNSDGTLRDNPLDSTLLRVIGGEASHLRGEFVTSGNAVLSNPAGITLEKGSDIYAHGILATTSHISNEDFLTGSRTGNYNFTKSSQEGAIINNGNLNIMRGGFATLIGKNVKDDGVIVGQLNRVVIAGAESYVLSFDNESLIGFEIKSNKEQNENLSKGSTVEHSGSIVNKGGLVLVTTKDAQKFVFEDSVNIKSIPQAEAIEEKDGVIILKGKISVDGLQNGGSIWAESSKDMTLENATLTANGLTQKGGNIKVLAPELRAFGTTIKADGKRGGGQILYGGDFQGKNLNINNSKNAFLDPNTILTTNALENGDGGQVVVWADKLTQNWATIESKGGAQGGNGGPKLEISGKEKLIHRGKIDTSAPKGEMGTILFDPQNIQIIGGGGIYANYNYGDSPAIGTNAIDPINLINIGNILLQATTDITVTDGFTLTDGQKLDMNAGRNIIINANIATTNADMTLIANAASAEGQGSRTDTTPGGITSTGHTLSSGTGLMKLTVDAGDVNTRPAGPIYVGTLSASNNITVTTPDQLQLNSNITTTTAGDINLTGGLGIFTPTTTTIAGAGNVTLNNNIIGTAKDLTITAGGSVALAGGTNLHNFSVTAPQGISISAGVSSANNQTYTGDVTLTGTQNMTFASTAGDLTFSRITGNGHNLALNASATGILTFGPTTNVGAFSAMGANRTLLNGSVSAGSQTYGAPITLNADLTLQTTTGDLTLNSTVVDSTAYSHALTLDVAGNLVLNYGLANNFINLKSLTITNATNQLGTLNQPVHVSLGDHLAPTLPNVLSLGSKNGGYFSGALNGQTTNAQYSTLIIPGASGAFYVNGTPLSYPPTSSSPMTPQQEAANDQTDAATRSLNVQDEVVTQDEKEADDETLIQGADKLHSHKRSRKTSSAAQALTSITDFTSPLLMKTKQELIKAAQEAAEKESKSQ